MLYYWLVYGGTTLVVLAFLGWFVVARYGPAAEARHARQRFELERSRLQQRFFEVAAAGGKPRGLRWKQCQWELPVEFARDRQTMQLLALVGVTVSFEAVAGGDMEGWHAVDIPRTATAVFAYDRGRWHATGKAVFNKNPDETIAHFAGQYLRVPPAGG